ncbi:Uncharacterised protein [Enterobacter cloacae]|nr:Uncharacterised protein [Enterobacter cloacae]
MGWVKSMLLRRCSVMFIAEFMASNFFASRPGINASNEVSTQLHFSAAALQMAFPSSTSNPSSSPEALRLSNGGYSASSPYRNSVAANDENEHSSPMPTTNAPNFISNSLTWCNPTKGLGTCP